MKILAIEFASDRRSVAVVVDGETRGTAAETGGRNTRALGLIEHALFEAGTDRDAIEVIVVGLGPGSYAGIRTAISTAQGWQLARGVRLMGINTVEGLATQAQGAGLQGAVHIAIDAQRGEFYFASYDLAPREIRSVATLHLATEAEVRQKAAAGVLLIWPELKAIFPQGRILVPEAAALGRLAAGRSDFASGEKLEPVYLRETAFVKATPPRWIPIP